LKVLVKSNINRFIGIFILLLILVFCILGSILLGYTDTNLNTLINTYTHFDGSHSHLIIKTTRVPRALIALFVGSSLGVSGVLMQALTRNPMASPSIFGINSGSSFLVVLAMSSFPTIGYSSLVWVALIGAAFSAFFVYLVAGGFKGDVETINLTLAGAATSALFLSLTQGVLYKDQRTLEDILFWLTGSVEGRSLSYLFQVGPYIIVGLIISLLLVKKLNLFSLGEEISKGLGLNVGIFKIIVAIAVVLLSGSSVAIAGPITLVGLIVPHITRSLVGTDYKWIMPYSILIGAIFLLLSDIGARFIIFPKEVPVGAITAFIGAPFFIYIARKAENR
jgi:iron complex transport system permease protein